MLSMGWQRVGHNWSDLAAAAAAADAIKIVPGPSVHGIFQARILEFGHFLLQGIFPI